MRKLELRILKEHSGRQIKSVLKSELMLSGSIIKQIKLKEDGITLIGVRVHTDARVNEGDILLVNLESSKLNTKNEHVVYADDDIVIFDKPAGMAVHPAPLLKGELTVKDVLSPCGGFHPVNRLDKGTTGLMVIALSGYMHDRLKALLHTDGFVREYLAVTEGIPDKLKGRIDAKIARQGAIKREVCENGAPALTDYEVVKTSGKWALVKLRLLTGRTHQIRVHMAHIGCPLAGDWLYGREDKDIISRPALHSSRIILKHPITGDKIDIFSPLPKDMEHLIK